MKGRHTDPRLAKTATPPFAPSWDRDRDPLSREHSDAQARFRDVLPLLVVSPGPIASTIEQPVRVRALTSTMVRCWRSWRSRTGLVRPLRCVIYEFAQQPDLSRQRCEDLHSRPRSIARR